MAKTKKSATTNGDKLVLNVASRTTFGKKLKKLRKEGMLPANIYGPDYKSQSVSLGFKDFLAVYKVAKETGVVYLKLNNDELPTLIKYVQTHPVNDHILHIDFRKIDLKQKIQTKVPVKVIGQSEAVLQKNGVLLTLSDSLSVEALPTNIPHQIEIDISILKEIGKEIKVSDLKKSDKYEIKDPAEKVIVSVVEHKEESVTPETAPAEAPEVITAAPVEEGVAPAEEGGKPASPKTTESKQVEGKPTGGKAPDTKPASAKAPTGKPIEGKK